MPLASTVQNGPTTNPTTHFPQHCLYFFPLPQGQGSFRPTLGPVRMGLAFSCAAAASLTTSLALPSGPPVEPVDVPPPKALLLWCNVCLGMLRRKSSNAFTLEALRKMLWPI